MHYILASCTAVIATASIAHAHYLNCVCQGVGQFIEDTTHMCCNADFVGGNDPPGVTFPDGKDYAGEWVSQGSLCRFGKLEDARTHKTFTAEEYTSSFGACCAATGGGSDSGTERLSADCYVPAPSTPNKPQPTGKPRPTTTFGSSPSMSASPTKPTGTPAPTRAPGGLHAECRQDRDCCPCNGGGGGMSCQRSDTSTTGRRCHINDIDYPFCKAHPEACGNWDSLISSM